MGLWAAHRPRKTTIQIRLLVSSVPSLKFASKIRCHPERSLPRLVRQTESKDLRLSFNELRIQHTRMVPARFRLPAGPDSCPTRTEIPCPAAP